MNTILAPTRHKLTVEDYHKLGSAGILAEDCRVELIDGDLIDMAPIGGAHMRLVNRLTRLLVMAVGDRGVVSVQNPVALPPYSEPQPDVAILAPGADGADAGVPKPGEVLLVIEVADTTLAYDRGTKFRLYASAGIPEMWIVNLASRCVEVFSEPKGDSYLRAFEVGIEGAVIPSALPAVNLTVSEIFG